MILYYSANALLYHEIGPDSLAQDDWTLLNEGSARRFRIIRFIDEVARPGEKVLLFRPSDFGYYGRAQYMSYLDPHLIQFYKTTERDEARQILLDLGIRYVLLPDYLLSPYSNSQMSNLVGDLSFSHLLMTECDYRLYRLHEKTRATYREPVPLANADFSEVDPRTQLPLSWTLDVGVPQIGQRGTATVDSEGDRCFYLENPGRRMLALSSGRGRASLSPSSSFYVSDMPAIGRFEFRALAKGRGILHVGIVRYMPDGAVQYMKIWDAYLNQEYRPVRCQFQTDDISTEFRVVIRLERRGKLWLKKVGLDRMSLTPFVRSSDRHPPDTHAEWEHILSRGSESVGPSDPSTSGWSSQGGPDSFGVSFDAERQRYSVYCKQTTRQSSAWLHTGDADASGYVSASAIIKRLTRYERQHRITQINSLKKLILSTLAGLILPEADGDTFRISAVVKGNGGADLFVWWNDGEGEPQSTYLRSYFLPDKFERLRNVFRLPRGARDLQIAFRPTRYGDKIPTLHVETASIERRIKP